MSNKKVSTTVNLPEVLVAKIDEERKHQRRSRSNMIEWRLMKSYGLEDSIEMTGGARADEK